MKKRLIIVGAGGLGRELLSFIASHGYERDDWVFSGFLNDSPHGLDTFDLSHYWLGDIQSHIPLDSHVYLIAVANPLAREALFTKFKTDGANFINYFCGSAFVGERVRLGSSCIVLHNSVISTDSMLGDAVIINSFCSVGHDTTINSFVTLSGHCDITGGVCIDRGVFIGSSVSVAPGKKIGKCANVGIGSVVIKNVKPYSTVFGNPAKTLFISDII